MRNLARKLGLAAIVALIGLGSPAGAVFAQGDPEACGCQFVTDCNCNGVDDRCDVSCSNAGTFCEFGEPLGALCNSGFFPSCHTSNDCNANGVPDECDIAGGASADCNTNTIPDECDLAGGAGCDANLNNVPDDCEIPGHLLFVDKNATGANDGATWADAFADLQDALAQSDLRNVDADPNNDVLEIWIAAGTYMPDDGVGIFSGDRNATFQLLGDVGMYGGFSGSETCRTQRNPATNATILSGDLNGDGQNPPNLNSFHVVTGSGTGPSAVIDGFTITQGNPGMGPIPHGAGMLNLSGSPTVANCVFSDNLAEYPAPNEPTPAGGGMFNRSGSSPTITNCTFINNEVRYFGGGIYNTDFSSPIITNCAFYGNTTQFSSTASGGGGICNNDNSNPLIINCLFSGNSAGRDGGGVGSRVNSHPTLINCTFSGNTAAIRGGGVYSNNSPTILANCIFWGNQVNGNMGEVEQIKSDNNDLFIDINFSLIQGLTGGLGGVGNIGDDPLFLDADGADGTIGTLDDDARLTVELIVASPAIGTGNNGDVTVALDLFGSPRIYPLSGIVDMGAQESRCDDAVCDPGETRCSCGLDCGAPPVSESSLCSDGVDNDCDGCLDGADADCFGIESSCSDGKDNDCDGDIDCADTDCNGTQECSKGGGTE